MMAQSIGPAYQRTSRHKENTMPLGSFRLNGLARSISVEDVFDPFVILIKTDNPGDSNNNQITLPLTGTYTIDWGDGVEEELTDTQTHTYSSAGTYQIKIKGALTRIEARLGGDQLKFLEIQNWGDPVWTTFQNAYLNCNNIIITATDAPDLSLGPSFRFAFGNCTSFTNPQISHWNMSAVTTYREIFSGCINFNSNINDWAATPSGSLFNAFANCQNYNQPMDKWFQTTTPFTGDMRGFLAACHQFNQPVNMWNVKPSRLQQTFASCFNFNQPVSNWDTSNCANFRGMFSTASSFNQPLLRDGDKWNTERMTNGIDMFRNATSFNQDLSGWCVPLQTDQPGGFDTNTPAWNKTNRLPLWGTCP